LERRGPGPVQKNQQNPREKGDKKIIQPVPSKRGGGGATKKNWAPFFLGGKDKSFAKPRGSWRICVGS